jgi:hypothetical protein
MKAKKIVSEESEQPNPLPAPSNEERKDQLAGWQKEIVALAEARLSLNSEQDLVPHLLRRAIALCRVVEDFSLVGNDNDLSIQALGRLMEVVQEDIQVAKWITSGRPLLSHWD